MSDPFWRDAKASVVLLPSGTQGEDILALAERWTGMGLLSPALYVMPENVGDSTQGPPRIDAIVLGTGEDLAPLAVSVDLFEALAEEQLAVLRLVKLRAATLSREVDEAQDAIADLVRSYVRLSMPLPSPAANIREQTTTLSNVTLVCAPSGFQLRQRVDWASSETGIVVVASPEDRSSPWSGDAFVRDDERFVGFTLMHLASVAGLWAGVPDGSFELMERQTSGSDGVYVSRVFLNAVLTESLGQRIAAGVLQGAADPRSLLIDPSVSPPPRGTAYIDPSQITAYVDRMVDGAMALDDGLLAFDAPAEAQDPPRRRFGFWMTLWRFLVFSGAKLGQIPWWTWRWISSRAHRTLTRTLHTEDGSAVSGPSYAEVLDIRDRQVIEQSRHLLEAERTARAEASTPAGLASVRTTPRLWAGLRELVFGSLDGSADLSSAGFAPVEGQVPVFGRVSDVLALPGEPWLSDDRDVPPDFPASIDWYAVALEDPRARLGAWVAAADSLPPELVPETDPASDPAGDGPPAGDDATAADGATADDSATAAARGVDGDPAAVAAPPVATPERGSPAGLAAIAAAEEARRRAARESRTAALDSYDEWAAAQSHSFVWRLLGRLADERRSADLLVARLVREIGAVAPFEPGTLLRLRRTFHRTVLITVIVAAVLGALGLGILRGLADAAERDPDAQYGTWQRVVLWALAALLAVVVAVVLGALVRYHAGWSAFERRIDVERAKLRQLGARARRAREEGARLRSLHKQAVEWVTLLSTAIHRPWHVPAAWSERDHFDVVRGAMPFATQIATIDDSESASTLRMRSSMAGHLLRKGWRHDAFEALVQEMAADNGARQGFSLRALDEDLPHASNHTRQMLLRALDDEALLTRVATPRLVDLVRASQREEQETGRPKVRPVGSNPLDVLRRSGDHGRAIAEDVPWDDFLLTSLSRASDPMTPLSVSSLTDLRLPERHHERVTSFLVIPERLRDRVSGSRDADLHVVPVTAATGAAVDLAWRVDVVGPVPKAAIRLWEADGRRRSAPTAPPSTDAPDTGV
ncbi:hypothetical protein C5B94_15040 [Clavibacter michiganensis]|uniref:hypothetical protein n=1 Tax=Clavibacter michiganensis TaxID=28447 RepID=UPI000CE7936C|nr:hypothetical protein [Clavibacter michiganensis]PPF51093.1 hypothetical protein C5B94_15040 [Clavibacter michiganensis]